MPVPPPRSGVPSQVTPFARLAAAHAVSTAGDAFVTVALAGSLFFTTDPAAARPRTALYLAFTMAPFAVIAPLIGPLLDRLQGGRRLIVVITQVARIFLCLGMAANIDGLMLYPLAFGLLVMQKTYSVAKSSLVPAVVDDDAALVKANSRLSLIGVVGSSIAAPPAAGILQLGGGSWVLRVGALVYLAGAVVSLQIPRGGRPIEAVTALEEEELRASSIRLAGSGMGLLRGAVGFLTFLLAFELKEAGEPAWFFGLVIAASGLGSFLGAVAAPVLRRRISEEALLQVSLLAPAVVCLFAARSSGRVAVVAAALIIGVGASAGKLAFDSLVQRDAPDASRGRAFASFETRFQVVWVAGALIPVILPPGLRIGLLLLALVLLFAGLSYLGGVRSGAVTAAPRPSRRARLLDLRAARRARGAGVALAPGAASPPPPPPDLGKRAAAPPPPRVVTGPVPVVGPAPPPPRVVSGPPPAPTTSPPAPTVIPPPTPRPS
jgi:hypothetical protein